MYGIIILNSIIIYSYIILYIDNKRWKKSMNISGLKKEQLEDELIKYVNSYFVNLQKWQKVNNIVSRIMIEKNPYVVHKEIKDDLHWIFGIDFYAVYLRKKYTKKFNYSYHSDDKFKLYKDYIQDFIQKNNDYIIKDNKEVICENIAPEYNIFFIKQDKKVIGFFLTHSLEDKFSDMDNNIFNVIVNSYSLSLTNYNYYNKLEVANMRKLNLIENISREFKPMLNNILEYASLLNLHKTLSLKKKQNYINYIEKNVMYLKNLITNIFALSNEDFKTTKPELTTFNSRDAIIYTLTILDDFIKQRNINFITSIIAHDIFADLTKFNQIIFSLANNMIKFANDNDVIYVTSYIDKGHFYLEFKNKMNKYIDSDFITSNDIYYFNSQSADLSIIKKIVKQHNGKIKFLFDKPTNTIFLSLSIHLLGQEYEK